MTSLRRRVAYRVPWALLHAVKGQITLLTFSALIGGCVLGAYLLIESTDISSIYVAPEGLTFQAKVAQLLGPFDFLLGFKPLHWLIATSERTAFIVGFLFGAAGALSWGIHLGVRDRLWTSFNWDVLTPIEHPTAIGDRRDMQSDGQFRHFVPLRYVSATDGPRLEIWESLARWTSASLREAKPYSISLLVGRAGSGKSRTASEFARALGRRDVLGSRGWPAIRLIVGAWTRRIVPFVSIAPDDPWDTAIIGPSDKHEKFAQYLSRLGGWRPRRPTLLLLDDPKPGEAASVSETLAKISALGDSRFPIALLVVNQTVPQELGFQFRHGEWYCEDAPADPNPIQMSENAWLTEREALLAVFGSAGLSSSADEEDVRRNLYRVTKGNPLLVELAADWVRQGNRLATVTANRLRQERVTRISEALQLNGIESQAHYWELAVSTLVGGGDVSAIGQLSREIFGAAASWPVMDRLRLCFPSHPLNTTDGNRAMLPAVEPEIIADHFVDFVVTQINGDPAVVAEQILVAAFKVNPAHMLLQIGRPRAESSQIAKAIAALDPAKIQGLRLAQWAEALTSAAIYVDLTGQTELSEAAHKIAIEAAKDVITRLDTGDREVLALRLAGQVSPRPEDHKLRYFHVPALFFLVDHALMCGPEKLSLTSETCLCLFERFAGSSDLPWPEWSKRFDGLAHSARSFDLSFSELETVWRAAWRLGANTRDSLAEFFSNCHLNKGDPHARSWAITKQTLLSALRSPPKQAHESAERAFSIAEANSKDSAACRLAVAALGYEAYAWSRLDHGVGAKQSRSAANKAVLLAKNFPIDLPIQRQVAAARGAEAYAWSQLLLGKGATKALAAAEDVVSISNQFPLDISVNIEAAAALRDAAYAWSRQLWGKSVDLVHSTVQKLQRVAERFPNDPIIQTELAAAIECETYAWSQQPEGVSARSSEEAASRVSCLANRFPAHPPIWQFCAKAFESVAYSWRQQPDGVGAAMVSRAANSVDQIANAMPFDRDIQQSSIATIFFEASAWAITPLGMEASRVRRAADRLKMRAATDPKNAFLRIQAARAMRCVAYAFSQKPLGEGANEALRSADTVQQMAEAWPDDIELQREAADARAAAIFALARKPAGSGARQARIEADKVEDIARKFAADERLRTFEARARRHEASTWNHLPDGIGAKEARAAADTVVSIASMFPRSHAIQLEAACARRMEVFAWSLVPSGAEAETASSIVEAIDKICSRFPNDPEFQFELVQARRMEAAAWNGRPNGSGMQQAQRAATKAAEVARLFPQDSRISGEAADAQYWADQARRTFDKASSG